MIELNHTPTLANAKADKIASVNPEAKRRIEEIEFEVPRVQQRIKLGLATVSDELAAYKKIEDIRQASNKAKIDINALPSETTIEEVNEFTW